jgi:hypothetical membrane protein
MADIRCYAVKCNQGMRVVCLSTLSGILAPAIFLIVMVTVESLQPGYNPVQDTISRLVLGQHGWVQTLSFFIFGFLYLVFTLRLYTSTSKEITTMLGTTFFLLSGFGFFILGGFPTIPEGATPTVVGTVHSIISTLIVMAFIPGCFSYAIYFRKDGRWHKFWLFSVFTAIACLVFSVLWKFPSSIWAFEGLAERLFALTAFLWVEVVSIRLLRNCTRKEPA